MSVKACTFNTHQHPQEHGGNAPTNEALPSLLWTQLDERRFAEEEAKHVCHHVIDDDHGYRNNKPDHALSTTEIIFVI